MADDDAVIKATAGPYRGKRLTVSAADAKAAIKDGWAIDPFAEPAEAKELTDEERAKVVEKAEAAAAKLRGETEAAAETKTRAMEAEDSAEYQTKSSKSKK